MLEIPGIVIILTVVTIALMGGFSSRKHRVSKYEDHVINSITGEYLTPAEVRRIRENKTPMRIEAEVMGDTVAAQRERVAELNVGDTLFSAWGKLEEKHSNRDYFIAFVDLSKKIYAVANDDEKKELALRYDYIMNVVIADLDKETPRMVLDILFE